MISRVGLLLFLLGCFWMLQQSLQEPNWQIVFALFIVIAGMAIYLFSGNKE